MKSSACTKSAWGTLKSRLCMYGIGIALLAACAKHPAPQPPGPVPEKDYGSDETALADGSRGRGHTLEDFDKPIRKSRVTAIEYSPVYFALNSDDPLPDSRETLETMAEEMPKYQSCRIEGHTCPLGESGYNMALSHRRAESVVSYLRAAGVRTGFQVIAYGEEKPITEDPAQYALNRRVIVECDK